MGHRTLSRLRACRGQAMVETLVVLFVALLLLLGIVQFGLIYNAKITLNYAAFEAARAGALNYADKRAIEYALAVGLSPIYTSVDPADSSMDKVKAVQVARDRLYEDEISNGRFACIQRINPAPSHFAGNIHGIADNTGLFVGQRLIPNDHLRYRSALPKGSPPVSIQDANLLKLRVTYCYPMYVPIIANTVKWVMGMRDTSVSRTLKAKPYEGWSAPAVGDFQAACYKADEIDGTGYPRIPLVAQAIVRMQTPAKNDTFPEICD